MFAEKNVNIKIWIQSTYLRSILIIFEPESWSGLLLILSLIFWNIFYHIVSNAQVLVVDVQFANYPVALDKSLNLTLTLNNQGNPITKLTETLSIEAYGNFFFSCGWHFVALLPPIDGCSSGNQCPQPHGQFTQTINVDLSPYQGVIGLLPVDEVKAKAED